MSRWLEGRRLGLDALSTERVEVFLAQRRRSGRSLYRGVGCGLCSDISGGLGLICTPVVASTPLAVLLADYRRYLVVERGLAPLTVQGYLKTATWFCTECLAGDDARVSELSAADVSGFLRRTGAVRQVKTVNNIVGDLRSLLRFLYMTARIDVPLAQAALGRARLSKPVVAATFAPLVAGRLVAVSAPVIFELGFSARSPGDYRELMDGLAAYPTMRPQTPTTVEPWKYKRYWPVAADTGHCRWSTPWSRPWQRPAS